MNASARIPGGDQRNRRSLKHFRAAGKLQAFADACKQDQGKSETDTGTDAVNGRSQNPAPARGIEFGGAENRAVRRDQRQIDAKRAVKRRTEFLEQNLHNLHRPAITTMKIRIFVKAMSRFCI